MKRNITRLFFLIAILFAINDLHAQTTGDFQSLQSGNWELAGNWQTWNGSAWVTAAAYPQYNNVTGANVAHVLSGHTMTISAQTYIAGVTIDAGAIVNINPYSSGNALLWIYDGSLAADLTVNGTLNITGSSSTYFKTHNNSPGIVIGNGGVINVGTNAIFQSGGSGGVPTLTINTGGSLVYAAGTFSFGSGGTGGTITVNSGGTYKHAANGGTIPTATWNTGSTCLITGMTSTAPSALGQSFSNVTFNCPSLTNGASLNGALTTINGTLTVISTGSSSGSKLRLGMGAAQALTIGGDLVIDPGGNNTYANLVLYSSSGAATAESVTVNGDLSVNNSYTGSTSALYLTDAGSSSTNTFLYLKGNYYYSSGTISTNAGGQGTIVFNGSAAQTFDYFNSSNINFILNNSAGVVLANTSTSPLTLGTLTLTSGTLSLDANSLSFQGLNAASGNIDASTASITASGNSAITVPSGTFLNNKVNNLTINNAGGVTLGGSLGIITKLTLTNGAFATGGNLTLLSTASGTASVTVGSGTISGNVTVQRYLNSNQRGWRLLGSPLTTAVTYGTLAGSSTTPIDITYGSAASVESYASSTDTWPGATASSDTWAAGTGIALFVRGKSGEGIGADYPAYGAEAGNIPGNITVAVTGTLNTAAPAAVTTTTNKYYLVANPYAAPISVSSVLAASTGISSTVSYYNPAKASSSLIVTAGGYNTATPSGAAGSATDLIIPSMGAFFVQDAGAGGTVNVPTSAIFTGINLGSTATYGAVNAARIKLSISNEAVNYDELNIQFDANSSASIGDKYDFGKQSNVKLDFYSISSDNKRMAFDERNDAVQTIALGIKTALQKNFTITVDEYSIPDNMQLVLKDKFLNTTTTLQTGTTYDFSVTADAASQGDKRFEITVAKTAATASIIANAATTVQVGPNPATDYIQVNTVATPTSAATVSIKLLSSNGVSLQSVTAVPGASVKLPVKAYDNGIYLVQVTDGKQVSTIKVMKN